MRKHGIAYILLALAVLLFAGCGEKLTEEQVLAKAREAELRVEYAQAQKYYERLLKEYPQSNETETARQKIALFNSAASLSEDKLQAEIQKYESHEQFAEALVLYNALLARFPNNEKCDEVLQKVGLIYLNNQEQYQRAVDTYQRLLRDFPQSKHAAQAQFMIGYIFANHIKDYDKARTAYNAFKEKYPQHELTPSVDWELEHLGKDISELDFIANSKDQAPASDKQPAASAKGSSAAPHANP